MSAIPPDETLPDREVALVPRLAAGDPEALDAFYDAHVDGLYAFVFYRVGKDATLAEDVLQETFVAALDRLAHYDPARGSLLTWLCVLSRNVIRHHLRQHQRERELGQVWDRIDADLAAVYDALAARPLSDEVVARNETRDLVNMTVAHLPERYRTALEGHYVAGESLDALGQRLHLTAAATKSLLARARRAFRATFETLSQWAANPETPDRRGEQTTEIRGGSQTRATVGASIHAGLRPNEGPNR